MQKYRLLIHGRNLLTEVEGVRKKVGFFTTVHLEAFTPTEAETTAIELLKKDPHLSEIRFNREDDPLILLVDKTQEIETFDGLQLPRTGLSLYEEKAVASKPAT